MTAVTIKFEDKLFYYLKQKADKIGYSIDNYILSILATKSEEAKDEDSKHDDIDAFLNSMQFQSGTIPTSEDGKGSLRNAFSGDWGGTQDSVSYAQMLREECVVNNG